MDRILKWTISSAFLCLAVSPLHAASMLLTGTVTEEGTGAPISGATIAFIKDAADTLQTITGRDGEYSLSLNFIPVSVHDASRPETFMLNQNYPNPFNPSTTIEFLLNRPGEAQLSIYNIMGQKIRQLADGYHEAGLYRVVWDGADENGRGVSAGVYLYRLTIGGQSLFRKMLLLDGGGKRSAAHLYPATVLSGRSVKKQAVSSRYTLSVKREGYVTFENYKYILPSSGQTDVALQKKSGATLYGSLQYNCGTNYWSQVIDPIEVIVYDSGNYSTKLSSFTIEYPDTTFEVTGLPEGIIDLVIQGDDVISTKRSEISVAHSDNICKGIVLNILYDKYPQNSFFMYDHLLMAPKKPYDTEDIVITILKEYGCTFNSYRNNVYYGTINDFRTTNSVQIVKMLNKDQRVSYSYVVIFARLDDFIPVNVLKSVVHAIP